VSSTLRMPSTAPRRVPRRSSVAGAGVWVDMAGSFSEVGTVG
jgi:hypothetical protein